MAWVRLMKLVDGILGHLRAEAIGGAEQINPLGFKIEPLLGFITGSFKILKLMIELGESF
jgi:hypothetical protein